MKTLQNVGPLLGHQQGDGRSRTIGARRIPPAATTGHWVRAAFALHVLVASGCMAERPPTDTLTATWRKLYNECKSDPAPCEAECEAGRKRQVVGADDIVACRVVKETDIAALIARREATRPEPPTPKTEREKVEEKAAEIEARAGKATRLANSALQEEGSEEQRVIAAEVGHGGCGKHDECGLNADPPRNRVGALAGLARLYASNRTGLTQPEIMVKREPDIVKAEDYAQRARVEAARIVQARREQAAAMAAEADTMASAKTACDASPLACKQRCEKGENPYCVQIAARFFNETPPKFAEARALLTKACDAKLQTGCVGLADVNKTEEKFQAGAERAFASVTFSIDDIAKMRFKLRFGRKTFTPSAANVRGLGRMEADAARKVRDDYCPARQTFIEQYGKVEFAKRATEHCEESPPSEGGVGGGDEPLTGDCKAVVASACPPGGR